MPHAPEPITRGVYDAEDRDNAVSLYLQTGSMYQVHQLTGIPKTTLHQWKHSDWWPEVVRAFREEKNAVQEANMTVVLDKTLHKINERLDQGDPVLTKEGDIVHVPLKTRDLAYVAQVLFDRRQLLRGANVASEENEKRDMAEIMKAFSKIAKDLHEERAMKVVSTQEVPHEPQNASVCTGRKGPSPEGSAESNG